MSGGGGEGAARRSRSERRWNGTAAKVSEVQPGTVFSGKVPENRASAAGRGSGIDRARPTVVPYWPRACNVNNPCVNVQFFGSPGKAVACRIMLGGCSIFKGPVTTKELL